MIAVRRPVPRRWRLPLAALGFCAGEAWAGALPWGLAVALATPWVVRRHRRVGVALGIVGAACVLGAGRSWFSSEAPRPPPPDAPLRYLGAVEDVWAAGDPEARPRGEVILRLRDPPAASGFDEDERMRITVWRGAPAVALGERIEVVARARRPAGLCNAGVDPYASAMRRLGIAADASVGDARALSKVGTESTGTGPGDLGRIWRARTRVQVDEAVGPREAGVVRALVLGDQRGIDPEVRRDFARTGTTHVLSVSGLHVALVATAVFAIVRVVAMRVPILAVRISAAPVGALAAMPAVAVYAWLTSPAAPILRAAVMAELALVAVALRRRIHFPTSFAIAALGVGAVDAAAPWDLSAQLSFTTLLWIWAGMRWIERDASGRRRLPWRSLTRGGPVARLLPVTLGAVAASALATVGAAPLLAWHFGEVSLVGLLANPIIVPLMGWGALAAGLAGMLWVPLSTDVARTLFAASGLCVRASIATARILAEWPFAVIPIGWRSAAMLTAGFAGAMLPATTLGRRLARGVVGALLAALLAAAMSEAPTELRASFLDVGQGDAALVELGSPPFRLLVDGGGFALGREPGERVLLPALRHRGLPAIDAVVVSHPDWDHFGGLGTVIREGKAEAIWWAGQPARTSSWQRFEATAEAAKIPFRTWVAGTPLGRSRSGGSIEVLHPPPRFDRLSANEGSLVLRVRYGAVSLLFTGDVEGQAEAVLTSTGAPLSSTVLKVPHHGSATSSGEAFVGAVRPAIAVASLGRGNRFRFPAAAVVQRYRQVGAVWFGTDVSGEVSVASDGQLLRVRSCRAES
jgi:competence protein ComEC